MFRSVAEQLFLQVLYSGKPAADRETAGKTRRRGFQMIEFNRARMWVQKKLISDRRLREENCVGTVPSQKSVLPG